MMRLRRRAEVLLATIEQFWSGVRRGWLQPNLPARASYHLEDVGSDAAGIKLIPAIQGFLGREALLLKPPPAYDPDRLHDPLQHVEDSG